MSLIGSRFPEHWGEPPTAQTRDLRILPGGYGRGSSTLAKWIKMNMDKDAQEGNTQATEDMLMDLATRKFPAHWGQPPRIQTMDYRKLPGDYGFGSGTLARWI